MTLLADLSSFLGTTWFIVLVGIVSYIVGSAFPVTALLAKFKKN